MTTWILKFGRSWDLDSPVDIVLDGFINYENHDILPITQYSILVCDEEEIDSKVNEWQLQHPTWQIISVEPQHAA